MASLDRSKSIEDDFITVLTDQDCRIDLQNLVAEVPLRVLLNAT